MLSVMYMFIIGETIVKHINIVFNLGSLTDWLSAIGTIGAVIVSLYLANKQNKPKIFLSFIEKRVCRVTNKSSQPVELRLLVDGKTSYSLALPPITSTLEMDNPRNNQPFNHDYMMFSFNPKKKKRVVAKGVDLITDSKYHFLFIKKDDEWRVKEYHFFHIFNFAI